LIQSYEAFKKEQDEFEMIAEDYRADLLRKDDKLRYAGMHIEYLEGKKEAANEKIRDLEAKLEDMTEQKEDFEASFKAVEMEHEHLKKEHEVVTAKQGELIE